MGNTHRIDIEPIGLGQRGQLYLVSYGGAVLVERSRNPEFDACRALLEQGATGRLEVWRRGTTCPALRLDIETGARLTVEESLAIGPRFARWQPRSEDLASNDLSSSDVSPRTAAGELTVVRSLPNSIGQKCVPPDRITGSRQPQPSETSP